MTELEWLDPEATRSRNYNTLQVVELMARYLNAADLRLIAENARKGPVYMLSDLNRPGGRLGTIVSATDPNRAVQLGRQEIWAFIGCEYCWQESTHDSDHCDHCGRRWVMDEDKETTETDEDSGLFPVKLGYDDVHVICGDEETFIEKVSTILSTHRGQEVSVEVVPVGSGGAPEKPEVEVIAESAEFIKQ